MSPEVEAALIAAGVGALTVAATVITQIIGFRSTRADTERQIKATHKDTADTLQHQGEQLDRTLADQRIRTLNERFATAAEQLGSDKPAVRLAGVYAMAGLADDWEENRQTCVDVLCAYLQLPYEPDPGADAPTQIRLAFQASQKVRHTVIRVIAAHLRDDAATSWQDNSFDFRGVVFDGGDFSLARFSKGAVNFSGAEFSTGMVRFNLSKFSGGTVFFRHARFSGGEVDFSSAEFSGGEVSFNFAEFSGAKVDFSFAEFSGGEVHFRRTKFTGGTVHFSQAEFAGGLIDFNQAEFSRGWIGFYDVRFSGSEVDFTSASFSGATTYFNDTEFSGGTVYFDSVRFSGGTIDFSGARFPGGTVDFGGVRFAGGLVNFDKAQFSGGTVDFSRTLDWSTPPKFPWTDTSPSGVKLPPRAHP